MLRPPVADSVILICGAWPAFAAGRAWGSPLVPPSPAAVGLLGQRGGAYLPGVGQSGRYAVDQDAERLVRRGQVCLTAVRQRQMPTVAPQAQRALTLLAKLPRSADEGGRVAGHDRL